MVLDTLKGLKRHTAQSEKNGEVFDFILFMRGITNTLITLFVIVLHFVTR